MSVDFRDFEHYLFWEGDTCRISTGICKAHQNVKLLGCATDTVLNSWLIQFFFSFILSRQIYTNRFNHLIIHFLAKKKESMEIKLFNVPKSSSTKRELDYFWFYSFHFDFNLYRNAGEALNVDGLNLEYLLLLTVTSCSQRLTIQKFNVWSWWIVGRVRSITTSLLPIWIKKIIKRFFYEN